MGCRLDLPSQSFHSRDKKINIRSRSKFCQQLRSTAGPTRTENESNESISKSSETESAIGFPRDFNSSHFGEWLQATQAFTLLPDFNAKSPALDLWICLTNGIHISTAWTSHLVKAFEAAMAKVSKFKPLTADLAVCAMPLMRRPPVEFRRRLPGKIGPTWGWSTCIRMVELCTKVCQWISFHDLSYRFKSISYTSTYRLIQRPLGKCVHMCARDRSEDAPFSYT